MKASNVAAVFAAFVASAYAIEQSYSDVMSSLAARSPDAAFYHYGDDHVVRAISDDFRIVARQDLEERHMAEWAAENGGEIKARSAPMDEAELLNIVAREQSFMRRRSGQPAPGLDKRQNCSDNWLCGSPCIGSCICQLSGQFSQRCVRR